MDQMKEKLEETLYHDEELTCVEKGCGATFVHSAGEQQWMRTKFGNDYTKPKRCPDCRKKNQERKRAKADGKK